MLFLILLAIIAQVRAQITPSMEKVMRVGCIPMATQCGFDISGLAAGVSIDSIMDENKKSFWSCICLGKVSAFTINKCLRSVEAYIRARSGPSPISLTNWSMRLVRCLARHVPRDLVRRHLRRRCRPLLVTTPSSGISSEVLVALVQSLLSSRYVGVVGTRRRPRATIKLRQR